MKKGFTLIELLAVIVILAIIAVIAVPIVLNIINDTKESATLRSADFYLDGVETAIAQSVLKNMQIKDGTYSIMEDGNICIGKFEGTECKEIENYPGTPYPLEVEIDGEVPTSGTIEIVSGQIENISLKLSDKVIVKNEKDELVFGEELVIKLAPGLYDENDNLLISWDDLTSLEYKSFTVYNSMNEEDVSVSAILNVSQGHISSSLDYSNYENYSSEHLVGKLVISDSVTSIGDLTFFNCTGLTDIIIPDSVTSIGSEGFYGCTGLTNIIIPDTVTSIYDYTFGECTSLTSITIPEGVTSIYDYTFGECTSLTSITIPEGVTSIGGGAFDGCTSLTSIIIPSGVTSISAGAFRGCTGLTEIVIPDSLTSIGEWAFAVCTNLATINYTGTQSQWNTIAKGEDWDGETPTDKTINYNFKA